MRGRVGRQDCESLHDHGLVAQNARFSSLLAVPGGLLRSGAGADFGDTSLAVIDRLDETLHNVYEAAASPWRTWHKRSI
jgi:hypothetical protein